MENSPITLPVLVMLVTLNVLTVLMLQSLHAHCVIYPHSCSKAHVLILAQLVLSKTMVSAVNVNPIVPNA